MEGTVPATAAAFAPTAPGGAAGYVPASPVAPGSGPNPALAGVLAGFFPFGVGAVYTGQYAKGLAHLVIWGLLMAGLSTGDSHGTAFIVVLAIATGFFYCYQIIDAVRSAKALQAGQSVPDPFGLAQTFSTGPKVDTSKIPTGAIVLIGIGVLFLLSTTGLFDVNFDHLWPLLLILLGGWILASRWGLFGARATCPCDRCRTQGLMGPAILMTIGVIAMIDSYRHVGVFGYAGGILLVIGGVKLFRDGASYEGHRTLTGSDAGPAGGAVPPPPSTPPTSEVRHG
jgi:hypothetical protein